MVQDVLFKDFFIFSSDGHFVQWSGSICAILHYGEYLHEIILCRPVVQEMSLKDFYICSSGHQLTRIIFAI